MDFSSLNSEKSTSWFTKKFDFNNYFILYQYYSEFKSHNNLLLLKILKLINFLFKNKKCNKHKSNINISKGKLNVQTLKVTRKDLNTNKL